MLGESIRRVRIPESVIMARARQAGQMSRTLPPGAAAQMGADVSAARLAEVVERRGFEDKRHGMGGQGRTMGFASIGREGGRAGGRRGARAGLLESGSSHVMG